MNFFEEIDKLKKDLPKIKTIKTRAQNIKLNFYQRFAIIVYVICLGLGIVLGNLFPTCSGVTLVDNGCSATQFNFFLMILFWFGSLIFCVLFFAIGRIITLLEENIK